MDLFYCIVIIICVLVELHDPQGHMAPIHNSTAMFWFQFL